MLAKLRMCVLSSVLCFFMISCASNQQDTPKTDQKDRKSTQQTEQNQEIETQENQENNEENTQKQPETMKYHNQEYGFTFTLPATWKGKYTVKKGNWEQQTQNIEAIFDFNYQSTNTNLFSVLVLDLSKEEWDRDYAAGLWGYLGERDGKIFAYAIPTELPGEWQEDKQSKVEGLIDVTKMVNIDVPRIVKTFKIVR